MGLERGSWSEGSWAALYLVTSQVHAREAEDEEDEEDDTEEEEVVYGQVFHWESLGEVSFLVQGIVEKIIRRWSRCRC